ncbi:uncharacterized protein ACMZJ9_002351 isoform 2-T3 [Mantella aurantiaca]
MYHRGGDRGWHQGHRRDVFPPRNHQSTPYRGGFHDHREHNNYEHNACHDRNYDDRQYMEYEEPTYHEYHEENRPYHVQRDSRDQSYHTRGRNDGGYQKDFRGGYHQSRGESGRYPNTSKSQHQKYSSKSFKSQTKESDGRMKTDMSAHNPVRSVATLVGGNSENSSDTRIVPSQNKSLAQEPAKPSQQDAKPAVDGRIPENNKKPAQDGTKPVQNGAKGAKDDGKLAQVSADPSKEDTKLFSENKKPSEGGIKPLDKGVNPAKEAVKVEAVETNKVINRLVREPVCDTKSSTTGMTTQLSCKIESLEDTKEDIDTKPVIKAKQEFSITGNETQEGTFLGKRLRSQDEDQFFTHKTVEIPLLGSWADMPSDSIEAVGTSTKRHPEPVVDLSHTAQELRRAFILAKKEEIELAFTQDCRTFSFVASTLLKKDPSLEVAVSSALRSTLQDIAGRCVQELSKFIDHYDTIPVNISEILQNANV